MKKLLSLALVLTLVLSTFAMLTVSSSAEETTLVEKGSEWQVLTYDNSDATAPDGWQDGEGEGWEAMNAPICGEAYSGGHNHGDMTHTIVTACHKTYMRKTFTVEDASAYTSLVLSVIYDEDPVVYINGEQVFTATGYHDGGYVDTVLAPSVLKNGENTICVEFKNAPSGGGSMLDLALVANDACINDDGTVIISATGSFNAEGNPESNPFGESWGGVGNLYDGDEDTVWGWGAENIYIVANLASKVKVTEIYLETKNEGIMKDSTDPHGEYTISYKDANGDWVEIGKVDALIDGKTVAVENVETDAIKVQVTAWYNDNWKSIAELSIKGEEIEEAPAPEGPAVIKIASWWNIGWENWINSPNNPNNVPDATDEEK
ncbi:MAG: hypothetical protein J6M12_01100, partial [Clostridia bacterium]|nr:hypothetical protein [Clostridia bacterium]